MKKIIVQLVPWVIVFILVVGLFFTGKFIKDNWDVISLKRNRPELVEAVLKVQTEETNELKKAENTVKENSIKKILSPLVIDTAITE